MHNEQTSSGNNKIALSAATTIEDVLTFMKDTIATNGITLNSPATENEIDSFEKNKIKLPRDFRTLYTFSNGFETDEDLFRLIPLEEIIVNRTNNYGINTHSFHFTEYMIYADMWTVEIDTDDIDNYKIYNEADDIVYLTNSLTEFLCTFINQGIYEGLYEWREKKSGK